MWHPYRIVDRFQHAGDFKGKCALAVMAKAPVPGHVKTRLSPPLTLQEAAALNACFLRDTVETLSKVALSAPAEWVISYTPEGQERAFDGILPEGAILLAQRGEDFGERLMYTAADLFSTGFSAVCLIDSDSPTVPAAEFRRAVEELLRPGPRAVLGPSADGGYYLLGLQHVHKRLFQEVSWSTELVAAQTLERCAEIDLPVIVLQTWYDVDDSSSLERLKSELLGEFPEQPGGFAAVHTREYLLKMESVQAGLTWRRTFV